MATYTFNATLEIVGVNPFVRVPERILQSIFKTVGKNKGPIPVCGELQGEFYRQTLVRYRGLWRLYVNTSMLKNSPQHVGERLRFSIRFDPADQSIAIPHELRAALAKDANARIVFESLPPSRQHEIVRYIAKLKTAESLARNVNRAIDFLNGRGSFAGRPAPE